MIKKTLGSIFMEKLQDPNVIEIMCNSDGSLWIDELGVGMSKVGSINPYNVQAAINVIASMLKITATKEMPIIEGEFPLDNSRFAAQLPPVVASPTFALRKKASLVFTLENYVEKNMMTEHQKEIIKEAIREHKNIVIVGGTSSGKTTLTNACIDYMSKIANEERIIIIEDTGEIQCKAVNSVLFHTTVHTSITDLLKTTLRMSPDRIIIGEVRDHTALDLLDAWSTGHPGGISTIHANNSLQALDRIEGLVSRHNNAPDDKKSVISNAVDLIINIRKTGLNRKVEEILELEGYDKNKNEYIFKYIKLAYAGGTLPFESGLTKISNSLSGPVAISIAVIAFAAAGIMYVFNPDATALIKGLIGLCIALGVMFGGKVFVDLIAKPSSSGCIITQDYIDKMPKS